jgi:hypothetical protein
MSMIGASAWKGWIQEPSGKAPLTAAWCCDTYIEILQAGKQDKTGHTLGLQESTALFFALLRRRDRRRADGMRKSGHFTATPSRSLHARGAGAPGDNLRMADKSFPISLSQAPDWNGAPRHVLVTQADQN